MAATPVKSTADEDHYEHDVDDVELVNLRAPVHRDIYHRPYEWRDYPDHLSVLELRAAQTYLGCRGAAEFSPTRALVVGENPGPHTDPRMPLFPWPDSSSAGRLRAMSELTGGQYLGGLYRRNLVDERRWSRVDAERRARSIVTALFEMPKRLAVVLCGRKVMDAFGIRAAFWEPVRLESRQTCVVIPHPSGLNHVYNDPNARARTRVWIRWAVLGEEIPSE